MYTTDYFKKWAVIIGYWGLGLSALFFISGIFFFSQKKITISLALGVLILSLLFTAYRLYIFSGDTSSSYLLSGLKFSFYFSMFLDVLFIIILLVVDKEYYLGVEELE